MKLLEYNDIVSARKQLKNVAVKTPLLENDAFNKLAGFRVLIKAECLQHTGSFKFRGAYNHISRLNTREKASGIICYSSGNHAQAVAAAAKQLKTNAIVVMPSTAPSIKIKRSRAYGAKVIVHDGDRKSLEERTLRLVKRTGRVLVKPFDDSHVIAGQGTVGLEIVEQLKEKNLQVNSVLVPCSGGGLTAGIALALKRHMPNTTIHPIEPKGFDDTVRSLEAGKRLSNTRPAESICDALLVPKPGQLTFSINQKYAGKGYVISDKAVYKAMKLAFSYFQIVLEPGGAIALAAVLSSKQKGDLGPLVVVGSGGNVDEIVFSSALQS